MRATYLLFLISKAVLAGPQVTYGYLLKQATGIPSGALYPRLHQLVAEGWLTEAQPEQVDPVTAGRPPRLYYEVTEQGREKMQAIVDGTFYGADPAVRH